jgi:hypothetical protein
MERERLLNFPVLRRETGGVVLRLRIPSYCTVMIKCRTKSEPHTRETSGCGMLSNLFLYCRVFGRMVGFGKFHLPCMKWQLASQRTWGSRMWSASCWHDNAIFPRHAMCDSIFAYTLESMRKSPKHIAVRITLAWTSGRVNRSGGSVAPLGGIGIVHVRRKWWSPRRRGWEAWWLDMDLHWVWRSLPLPRHSGASSPETSRKLDCGLIPPQPCSQLREVPHDQRFKPLHLSSIASSLPAPPLVPHPMAFPCGHLPVSSMRISPALLIFLPAQWETAIPRQVCHSPIRASLRFHLPNHRQHISPGCMS